MPDIQKQIESLMFPGNSTPAAPANGTPAAPGSALDVSPEISTQQLVKLYEDTRRTSFLAGLGTGLIGIAILKAILR